MWVRSWAPPPLCASVSFDATEAAARFSTRLIEFEICYSAQKAGDRDKLIGRLAKLFESLTPGPEVYDAARSMQEALTAKGAHRCCSPIDLVLAATAHVEDLTVLHVDKDYETVARFWPSFRQVRLDTGQPL
ncbi:PIN domain-containing protein [Streptomyces sp. G5(2025)]|uniref:PIN domain-containing protein n=1 Tax=Streptomyces sp. G5(2025) TaxID=3406628 RepID=UPI003C28E5E0